MNTALTAGLLGPDATNAIGRERRHGKVPDQHRVASASIDYALVTRNGSVVVEDDPGWDDEEALKLFIVKDRSQQGCARPCFPQEGGR